MMALSGVRSSWLMVARKRLFEASACSAAAARQIERLLLDLAVGDVAHHGHDFGFEAAAQTPARAAGSAFRPR